MQKSAKHQQSPMFSAYRIENRTTGKIVRIGRRSHIWAGLFGGFYLAVKAGPAAYLRAIVILIVFAAVIAGLVLGTARFVPEQMQPLVLLCAFVAILFVQALRTLDQVKKVYSARGWKIRREDD